MPSQSPTSERVAAEARWRNVEQQLDELVQLAADATFAKFFSALLQGLAQALNARAAVIWLPPEGRSSSQLWKAGLTWGADQEEVLSHAAHGVQHATLLEQRSADDPDRIVILEPAAGIRDGWASAAIAVSLGELSGDALAAGVRMDSCIVPLPTAIPLRHRTVAIIEVMWDSPVLPFQQLEISNLLSAFAEAAVEYFRREQVHDLQRRLDDDTAVDQFALAMQRQSANKEVWFTIANEVARLVPSDRVAVISAAGKWRVQAISHVDTFDRRSPVVRGIERLAAAADDRPVWMHATDQVDSLTAAPQWNRYLEESSARSVVLFPLLDQSAVEGRAKRPAVLGAVLIERLKESPFSASEQDRIERLCRHATAAVARLIAMSKRSFSARLKRVSTLAAIFILAGMVGAAFIPIDFEITARGELQPLIRQEVFAPADGVVRALHAHDGQIVTTGEILLELTNDELDVELTRIAGELQTARQQLVTVQSARLDPSPTSSAPDRRAQLGAEEERLKKVIQNLDAQYQLLLRRLEKLKIQSPIGGRIVTANIEQLLRSRPLRRGQRLMTVADESQAWILDLRVVDQDIGHILAARAENAKLPLQFIVATQPSVVHYASVDQIADWTDLKEGTEPGVQVTARIEDTAGLSVRPGATVAAKIHCGRRRLGYVWFRDLIELVRKKVMFWIW